jgi:hypothetical protein
LRIHLVRDRHHISSGDSARWRHLGRLRSRLESISNRSYVALRHE